MSSPGPMTKGEYAYLELRRHILEGELRPGQRMLLRATAKDLGVSIVPIRDAILRLKEDGLVELQDHRGATVTEVTWDDFVALTKLESWNEILAVDEGIA